MPTAGELFIAFDRFAATLASDTDDHEFSGNVIWFSDEAEFRAITYNGGTIGSEEIVDSHPFRCWLPK